MGLLEDLIVPYNEQIVGFAGERVDTMRYVDLRTCLGTERDAKEHANNLNLPPADLHNLVSPWPLAQWGMNIVGPLSIGRSQKKFLLVGIGYFTKWVE